MEQLRVLARYDAKITEQQNTLARFPNNYFTRPSVKDLRDNFLTKWPGMSKVFYIFKVTSRGRAEIQNGCVFYFLDIFNFSSATAGGPFSNVNILLIISAIWPKSCPSDF